MKDKPVPKPKEEKVRPEKVEPIKLDHPQGKERFEELLRRAVTIGKPKQ